MKGEAFGFLGALACLSVIPANLRPSHAFFCHSRTGRESKISNSEI